MTVNRYYKPIEMGYFDTFVPIDFDMLYKLGSAQKAAVDEARKELATQQKTWAEFQSLSDKDIESWGDLTYNNPVIRQYVEKAAADPSAMNDAAFRAGLQQAINNLDYGKMAMLKQSAKMLEAREVNKAKLIAENRYASWMDDVDIANWDTLGKGIMTELSPIAYKSLQELGEPYTKDLKVRYYGGNQDPVSGQKRAWTNGWMAITPEDIARSLNYEQIINSPQGAAWRKRYARMNPNLTADQIDNLLFNHLVQHQYDKITTSPIDDKLGFEQWKHTHPQNTDPELPQTPVTRLGQLQQDAHTKQEQVAEEIQNKVIRNLAESGQITLNELGQMSQEDMQKVRAEVFKTINSNPNYRSEASQPIDPQEYREMFGVNSDYSLTNNKGEGLPSGKYSNMEAYERRSGDVVYTTDGHVVGDVPKMLITGKSNLPYGDGVDYGYDYSDNNSHAKQLDPKQTSVQIQVILDALKNKVAAFNPGKSMYQYTSFENGAFDNRLMIDGQLVVPKEILLETIEEIYPEQSGDISRIFMRGFKTEKNGSVTYKIAKPISVKNAHLEGYGDLYVINMGRQLDNSSSRAMQFNSESQNSLYGAAATDKMKTMTEGMSAAQTVDTSSSWEE